MSSTGKQSFGQIIEADLKDVWTDVEVFGEDVVQDIEALSASEVTAITTAATGLLSTFVPKQIAQVQAWVKEFAAEVGDGAITSEGAVTAVLNKDAAGEGSFLNSVASTALSALVSAFIAAL